MSDAMTGAYTSTQDILWCKVCHQNKPGLGSICDECSHKAVEYADADPIIKQWKQQLKKLEDESNTLFKKYSDRWFKLRHIKLSGGR